LDKGHNNNQTFFRKGGTIEFLEKRGEKWLVDGGNAHHQIMK